MARIFDTKASPCSAPASSAPMRRARTRTTYLAIGGSMQEDDVFASVSPVRRAVHRGVKPARTAAVLGWRRRGSDFSGPAAWCVPIGAVPMRPVPRSRSARSRGLPNVHDRRRRFVEADFNCTSTSPRDALPLVAVIVNNQWAISVPRNAQTSAKTLAQRASPPARMPAGRRQRPHRHARGDGSRDQARTPQSWRHATVTYRLSIPHHRRRRVATAANRK